MHATHLTGDDIAAARAARTYACFCPTTERDLADGIGPSATWGRRLPLTLGSDSHAVIDLFEEMRAVELDERLATQRRGAWSAAELLPPRQPTATRARLPRRRPDRASGARADLVTMRSDSVRTAGTGATGRRPPSSPPPPPTCIPSSTAGVEGSSWTSADLPPYRTLIRHEPLAWLSAFTRSAF